MPSLTYIPNRVIDADGIADGASIHVYQTGTTTPVSLYLDAGYAIPTTNPYVVGLGAAIPPLYYNYTGDVRLYIVSDSGDIRDEDPYVSLTTSSNISTVATVFAATRTELAAKPKTGVAYLTEINREGTFVWSSTNNSANVTADTNQGIYVPPSSDTTGASGAWVRDYTTHVLPDWFGAVGDGTTNDYAALEASRLMAQRLGVKWKFTPGLNYKSLSRMTWDHSVLTEGWGSTLTFDVSDSQIDFAGGGIIIGLHIDILSSNASSYINIRSGIRLYFNKITRLNAVGTPCYLRPGANGFRAFGNYFNWYGGPNIFDASDWRFIDNDFINPINTTGDDGIAIKAMTASVYNWEVSHNRFYGLSNMVGIGSQVGFRGAPDPNYSLGVYGGRMIGNYGESIGTILYIKPGAIDGAVGSSYDLRDGLVDGIVVSDNEIVDVKGNSYQGAFIFTPGRGNKIRNVTGSNNVVIARCWASGNTLVGALRVYFPDFTATMAGSGPSSVENIKLGVRYVDPFGGYALGTTITAVGSAGPDPYDGYPVGALVPGTPVGSIVLIDRQTAGQGTVSNITLEIEGSGCVLDGIHILSGFDNAGIYFPRLRLRNINQNGSSTFAGVRTDSVGVRIGDDAQIDMLFGYPYRSSVSGGFVGPTHQISLLGAAAGTGVDAYPWIVPRRVQIVLARMVTSNTITASDTNYTTLKLLNKAAGDSTLAIARNKVTASGITYDNNITPVLGVPVVFYDLSMLTLTTSLTASLFASGNALHFNKADTGTGAALTDPRMLLTALPY